MSCYRETIARYVLHDSWTVRVWRQADHEVLTYEMLWKMTEKCLTIQEDAAAILEIVGVNAVEVTDHKGIGVVYYKDWP